MVRSRAASTSYGRHGLHAHIRDAEITRTSGPSYEHNGSQLTAARRTMTLKRNISVLIRSLSNAFQISGG